MQDKTKKPLALLLDLVFQDDLTDDSPSLHLSFLRSELIYTITSCLERRPENADASGAPAYRFRAGSDPVEVPVRPNPSREADEGAFWWWRTTSCWPKSWPRLSTSMGLEPVGPVDDLGAALAARRDAGVARGFVGRPPAARASPVSGSRRSVAQTDPFLLSDRQLR